MNQNTQNEVTIIVVPRERFSRSLVSLESILRNTQYPNTLIYIDGNSPGFISSRLQQLASIHGFTLIRKDHYLSPTPARNLGLSHAKTKYIVFVDNDIYTYPNWLEHLLKCVRETNADIVCPLILYGNLDSSRIHLAGGMFDKTSKFSGIHFSPIHRLGEKPCWMKYFLRQKRTDFGEFHCILFRTETLKKLGGLDENLLSAHEHYDICMTIHDMNGMIYFEPNSKALYMKEESNFLLSDLPFYMLRWSESWNVQSNNYFFEKWHFKKDHKYESCKRWQNQHRKRFLIKERKHTALSRETNIRHPYAQTNLELYDQLILLNYRQSDIQAIKNAYEFALNEFGGLYRASGRPFINHNVSTASILAAHGAAQKLIISGLLHDIYAQGDAGLTAFTHKPTNRLILRNQLGEQVEEILSEYYYLKKTLDAFINEDIDQMSITTGQAVIIRAANDLDEYLSGEYAYSCKPNFSIEIFWPNFKSALRLLDFDELANELFEVSSKKIRQEIPNILKSRRQGAFEKPRFFGRLRPHFLNLVFIIPKYGIRRVRQHASRSTTVFLLLKFIEEPNWVVKKLLKKIKSGK